MAASYASYLPSYTYFTPSSWSRAKKNKEDLEKTNPTQPVLKDEDEEFLTRITSEEGPAPPLPERLPAPKSVITDEGEEKELHDADVAGQAKAQDEVKESIVVPAVSPATAEAKDAKDAKDGEAAEDKEEAKDDVGVSKEEAQDGEKKDDQNDDDSDMKKSWASYLPSMPSLKKKKDAASVEQEPESNDAAPDPAESVPEDQQPHSTPTKSKKSKKDPFPTQEEAEAATLQGTKLPESKTEPSGRQTEDVSIQRNWSSYIPSVAAALSRGTPKEQASTSLASVAEAMKKAQETNSPTKNADGSETQDEKEVSVLLDNLNLSAINNRVFSFSKESEKLYENFTVVLKDIVNGAPTAYDDLEKLIKDNEKQLENMFGNMPPFVQTLVKSLPAKFASTLGPEVMAAMSEKPGADMKARMDASSSTAASGVNLNVPEGKKKNKRKLPSAKALVTEQGAVASMLKSILNFLRLRFPAFITGTNVLMSLAVFSQYSFHL